MQSPSSLCFIITLLFSASALSANTTAQLINKKLAAKPIVQNAAIDKNKQKTRQVIVVFNDVSLVKQSRLLTERNTAKNKSISALTKAVSITTLDAHKTILTQKRSEFLQTLRKKQADISVLKQYSSLLNGVAVATKLSLKEIKKIGNVKAVYPVRRYKRTMENLLPIIKATDAWQLLGGREKSGEGVKIAVIDSGIVPGHPMFADTGMTAPSAASLPNNDYCRTKDNNFCNNKLIVARHYVPDFINVKNDSEYDSPQGLSGHGTHVAGIATGRQVSGPNGEVISGVAPGAYLMVYKTLWGQDGLGSDLELLSAMEDAVADGANVINNSWGGDNGGHPTNTLYQNIYEELEANGVVVVTAAGNEGDSGSKSIACPGCIEAGITVGATTTNLSSGLPITFNSQTLYATPSDNFAVNSDINKQVEFRPNTNALGCNVWDTDSLINKIAVVTRGLCLFEEKANLAQNAGAEAIIVINNETEANITMSMGSATLPAVLVSQSNGSKLVTAINNDTNLSLTIGANFVVAVDSSLQDWIADFSSLGPNGDDSFIKPDIAAPGVAILSATSDEDTASLNSDYARFNGTSMATPAVTGAVALLKQYSPSLTALQIKQVLIGSSDAVVKNATGRRSATAFETGAGRLNVLNALNATTYANQPNMVAKYCAVTCIINNNLTSLSDEDSIWVASIVFDNANLNGQVLPNQLSLSATNKSANFSVKISSPITLKEDWYFGRIQWSNGQGQFINQAIAVHNQQQSSELLQTTIIEKNNITKTVQLISNNVTDNEILDVELRVSGGAVLATDSLSISGDNSHTIASSTEKNLKLTANVGVGITEFVTGDAPVAVNLVDEGVEPILCALPGCDEVLFEILFNFKHFGQTYSKFLMSDNGLIIAGNDVPADSELYFNLSFPNVMTPNNIIAPLWTDFNLINPNEPQDTGGGEMLIATYQVGEIEYLVLQWDKVKVYVDGDGCTPVSSCVFLADTGLTSKDIEFTFQLILQKNSENKWFRYIDIPEQPNFYSVGTENSIGTQGGTYWFDGEGRSNVTSGDEIKLTLSQSSVLTVQIDVEKQDSGEFSVDDEVTGLEDTSININVLVNDLSSGDNALLTTRVNNVTQVDTLFTSELQTSLDVASLTIVTPPQNGQVIVGVEGNVTYIPIENYNGEDSFTYSVQNSEGQRSTSTVSVTILPFNDLPILQNLMVPATINLDEEVTFSVEAQDVESNVTYLWDIPTPLSAINKTSSSMQVTVGDVETQQIVTVSVTVSDGVNNVTESATITVIPENAVKAQTKETSKGFLGLTFNFYLYAWLVLLLFIRRDLGKVKKET